jgi:curved DNA-binding protein CbpA
MKRINEYKKLYQIENEIDLAELKLAYRKLVKQWHPDKFQEGDPMKEEATLMGQQVVDGYHFLVSIAPETKAANLAEYQQTTIGHSPLSFILSFRIIKSKEYRLFIL